MAVNPMQRKANNSFLLGILITLLITGAIIALLFMQLSKLKKEKEAQEKQMVSVFVLSGEKKSGQIINADDLTQVRVNIGVIPENAITSTADFANYTKCDSEGRTILTKETDEGVKEYLVISSEEQYELKIDEETGKYYYEKPQTSERVSIELNEKVVIAKVNLDANTILTPSLVSRGELLASDIRKQEYNVITLPTQLASGEYIDIRLRLPNGQDYIVLSHKQVEIPMVDGVDSQDCIWLELSELEILNMSSAIVETYQINGAKLYATKYVEPGMQAAASATYLPSDQVIDLIKKDPNTVQKAKNELFIRFNNDKDTIRNPINSAKNNEDAQDNLQEGVQSEIQGLQEEREKYLESMGT